MQQLFALVDRPTAVFAVSDKTAFGAMEGVKDAGLRIPEDVSIVAGALVVRDSCAAPRRPLLNVSAEPVGELQANTHYLRLFSS